MAVSLILRHPGVNSPSQATTQPKTTEYQPFKTFTSPYFTFQTDKNWQAMPAEYTANIYVYRAFRNNLVERDLTVYVNTLPVNLMLTYILPVQVTGNKLSASDISQHCRNYLPASYLASSRNPTSVTVETVNFTCQTDGTSVTIGTGTKGGSYQTTMTRKNGTSAQYFLLYHDLTFSSRPEIFKTITESFKPQ